MTEILCTMDFSASSHDALRWSVDLARKLGAHLTILHTYRLFKADGEAVAMKRIIEEEAVRSFRKVEKDLLATAGIPYDFKSEVGFVSDRVEAHAKRSTVNLVVVGKDMSTVNKESFDELVSHSRVPVVVVP